MPILSQVITTATFFAKRGLFMRAGKLGLKFSIERGITTLDSVYSNEIRISEYVNGTTVLRMPCGSQINMKKRLSCWLQLTNRNWSRIGSRQSILPNCFPHLIHQITLPWSAPWPLRQFSRLLIERVVPALCWEHVIH